MDYMHGQHKKHIPQAAIDYLVKVKPNGPCKWFAKHELYTE